MGKTSQPQDKWFNDGDLRLHYLDWGNPAAKPMVLLHHHCGNARYWDFFARSMRPYYHILAVDNRGHGDSSRMADYGPGEYVVDFTKFVDNLELNKMVLIGHSLGGIIGIIYTKSHPDRVARLVIVDIGPEIDKDGAQKLQGRMGSIPEAFTSEEEMVRLMKQVEPYCSEDFIRHLARYTMKRDESGQLIFKYDPFLRLTKLGSPPLAWEDLEKIVCPTLVVHGAESQLLLPGVAKRMAETLPLGTLVDIERAGHNVPGDNPEAFEAAVRRFLA